MSIGNVKTTEYWRKTYRIEAVRLTLENMQQIADFLGGEFYTPSGKDPYIRLGKGSGLTGVGYLGEWFVKVGTEKDAYDFLSDEEFQKGFHTHNEQVANDEKYAAVFDLVMRAMAIQAKATYHSDTDGLDLVAIETTKKILEEL